MFNVFTVAEERVGEKRHGGGWPKGKSRKSPNQMLPPKLPATGYHHQTPIVKCIHLLISRYSFFVTENKAKVEKECCTKSMSVLSRRLGKMWADLTMDQKKVKCYLQDDSNSTCI